MKTHIQVILLWFIVALILIHFIIFIVIINQKNLTITYGNGNGNGNGNLSKQSNISNQGQCSQHTCSDKNIDPVSDPSYNMKEIAKQSILLEDHLTQEKKRCKDCIIKHFLSIQGYAEEGVSLANENVAKYPLLSESVYVYKDLFNKWLKDKTNDENMMHIAEQLREHRKKIVAIYYLGE